MTTLTPLATSAADVEAVQAVEQHHAQLAGALAAHVARLLHTAARGDLDASDDARTALVRWCRDELVPHAVAEEQAMYPPAHAMAEGRLLMSSMIEEHHVITGLVDAVEREDDPVRAAASATALQVVFDSHLAKENDLVLPLLAGSRDVSVAELLTGMHELLGEAAHGADHPDRRGTTAVAVAQWNLRHTWSSTHVLSPTPSGTPPPSGRSRRSGRAMG